MERCYVKKLCEDADNEYGIDQNLSMYIKKKDNIAWVVFYENRLLLKDEKNKNVKIIYKHNLSGLEVGVNEKGEFFKRKPRGLWTAFVEEHQVPKIFNISKVIATKKDHYWVENDEETIIKYKVVGAKKDKTKHLKGYEDFIIADRFKNQAIIEKAVFDKSTIQESVNILLNK